MELQEIIKLIINEVEENSYINISDFLEKRSLNKVKTKDLIREIDKKHSKKLLLDAENTEVYSYDLIYTYFKLKLFRSLETRKDLDLTSDDFEVFKSEDLIRIYSLIHSEFFDYLNKNLSGD
ncbi:MAG: hypothetical protein GF353_01320 [Candidatus Lokiarchaeota archaeon]|nr:hypothetical protein [Candidatus Lokiarchaeota archaeon]